MYGLIRRNFNKNYKIVMENSLQELEKDYMYLMYEESKRESTIKKRFKKELKGLINYTGLFNWFDAGHQYWMPCEIVEIQLTDEKKSGYHHSYQCARVIGEKENHLYMKTPMDEYVKGVHYYYVWQTCGYSGDDYSGYLLFKLRDGRFLKCSYAC